jgi:hypothetical protein
MKVFTHSTWAITAGEKKRHKIDDNAAIFTLLSAQAIILS